MYAHFCRRGFRQELGELLSGKSRGDASTAGDIVSANLPPTRWILIELYEVMKTLVVPGGKCHGISRVCEEFAGADSLRAEHDKTSGHRFLDGDAPRLA